MLFGRDQRSKHGFMMNPSISNPYLELCHVIRLFPNGEFDYKFRPLIQGSGKVSQEGFGVHFMVAELTCLDSVNLELDKHPTPDQVRRCFQDALRTDPVLYGETRPHICYCNIS